MHPTTTSSRPRLRSLGKMSLALGAAALAAPAALPPVAGGERAHTPNLEPAHRVSAPSLALERRALAARAPAERRHRRRRSPSDSRVRVAVAAAKSRIGAPYGYGASGPSSFDCSGLVMWAMGRAGISLPRSSFAQYAVGSPVRRWRIRPGDLVFFDTGGPGASHVGIATGVRRAVSATSHGVMVHPFRTGYWGSHFLGARRVE
jgi:cell wall-associated NlpC family hydrolase